MPLALMGDRGLAARQPQKYRSCLVSCLTSQPMAWYFLAENTTHLRSIMTQPKSSPDRVADIRRGIFRLARRLRAELAANALSANKVGMMSYLLRRGPKTLSELAVAECQQPQSLTRALTELEAAGMVSRVRSEDDRRRSFISLTEAGRAALEEDMARCDAWLAAALAELNETEREVLGMASPLMERLADATAIEHAATVHSARRR
jgi:DNA-binding MarR family transcriptional regulator